MTEPAPSDGRVPLPHPFRLYHGGSLSNAVVDYSVTGPIGAPVVVALGGISADQYPTRWWSSVVRHRFGIDLDRFRVLGIKWLGSGRLDYGLRPGSEADSERAYPLIDTRDQVTALLAVLDALGVDAVHAVVGSSYGGMVALAAAADHPERVPHAVVISAAHRSHPMATAHRAVQRGILHLGRAAGRAEEGVALARALAMTTYRTASEFEERFDAAALPETPGRFPVESYLDARGRSFSERWSPGSYAALSHSIDLHAVEPEEIDSRVDLVSVDSDELVPPWLMDELAVRLSGPNEVHHVRSPWGHDAFLKEADTIGRLLSTLLEPRPAAVGCGCHD